MSKPNFRIVARGKRHSQDQIDFCNRIVASFGEMAKLDARRLFTTITALLDISKMTVEEIEDDPMLPVRVALDAIERQKAMRREDS